MSDMSPHAILAQVAADVAEYRDQATEHARTAADLAEQMEKPGALLTRMADEEAELARKLEALRNEMLDIRRAYDALDEERRHHTKACEAKQALADGFEQVAADVVVRLDVPPPHEALSATGPPNPAEPGPVEATLYQEDGRLPMVWSDAAAPGGYVCAVPVPPGGPGLDLPGGARVCGMPVESEPCSLHGPDGATGTPLLEDPDALTAKTPLRTLTDPPSPVAGEPRHARPKEPRGSRTGGFKLPRLGHRDDQPTDQQTGGQQ